MTFKNSRDIFYHHIPALDGELLLINMYAPEVGGGAYHPTHRIAQKVSSDQLEKALFCI